MTLILKGLDHSKIFPHLVSINMKWNSTSKEAE